MTNTIHAALRKVGYSVRIPGPELPASRLLLRRGWIEVDPEWDGCFRITDLGAAELDELDRLDELYAPPARRGPR